MTRTTLRIVQAVFVCLLALLITLLLYKTVDVLLSNRSLPVAEERPSLPPPVRLQIPRLRIDAPVLPMGLTSRGGMEVPARAEDVGWFAYGVRPGEFGSAVLAGHRDTLLDPNGIFMNLAFLAVNDDVYIETASGETLHFRVRESQTYPYDEAPLRQIFAGSGGQLLNLITCTGVWDAWTYDRRLVVYTELVERGDDAGTGNLSR